MQRPNRQLKAILAADVVAFSSAMEQDDEGTLGRLGSLRRTVIDKQIEAHDGQVFKNTGDGFLVEFASSVDALRCAIAIQRDVQSENEAVPEAERFQFRIGVNIGDVLLKDGDVFGNGVNVAARLEGMAEPGGICLSGRVHEDAEHYVDAEFSYLGRHGVRNIRRPVEVYAVRLSKDTPQRGRPDKSEKTFRRAGAPLVLVSAVLLAVTFGLSAWVWNQTAGPVTGQMTQEALDLPKRPSLAILPFADLSPDADQRYFADGIAEDLTTDLSKVSELFVIARNSAFAYRDSQQPLNEIARALGVRYVLQGSVRRVDDKLRINAQLTDTLNDEAIWADRYDGHDTDVFALQDSVSSQIVSVLSVELTGLERDLISRTQTNVPAAYDVFLRGWDRYLALTPEDMKLALADFEEAIALDPEYGQAHAAYAAAHWEIAQRWWHGFFGYPNFHRVRTKAEMLLNEALKWETPLAYQLATTVHSQNGRHTEALAQGAKALALDPNNADTYAALAGALSLAGDADEAQTMIDQAMRLNPRSPGSYYYNLGLAEFGQDNFTRAAQAFEEAIRLNPEDRWPKRMIVATFGHLGETDRAAVIIEEENASWYGTDPFTVRAVTFWYPYRKKSDLERLAQGLRKAGLPE